MRRDARGRPERHPEFLTRIADLQRTRRLAPTGPVRLHDRSVFCTLALARFLDLPVPAALSAEIAVAAASGAEHRRVYLDHGFELVEVHPAAVDVRVDLVRAALRELTA